MWLFLDCGDSLGSLSGKNDEIMNSKYKMLNHESAKKTADLRQISTID